MLPEEDPTALPSTCQIAQDGKRELLERGARLDDPLEARDDPSLRSLFLPRLVEPTEVVARLEDMIGHFLKKIISVGKHETLKEPIVQFHMALCSVRPEF